MTVANAATKNAPSVDGELGRMGAIVGNVLYELVYYGRCYKLWANGIEKPPPILLFPAFEAAFKGRDQAAFEQVCKDRLVKVIVE